jgi:hypothetical protein
MKDMVSISYCGDHTKGPTSNIFGREHATMLFKTIEYVKAELDNIDIVVCSVGFPGWPTRFDLELDSETHYLWKIFAEARFVTRNDNPGYAEGATWSVRQALDAAIQLGRNYLIHMCEDVVPFRGELRKMMSSLKDTAKPISYIGKMWRTEKQFATQFFGCYVPCFTNFNGLGENGMLVEDYMGHFVRNASKQIIEENYYHTHTFSDYLKIMESI